MKWLDFARCKGMDPNIFHPEQHDMAGLDRARAICAQCPVIEPCGDHAIANGERGVWGGTSERERRRIRERHAGQRRLWDVS